MRILLNLLPEAEKQALARRFRFRFFTWQTTLLLLLEVFYLVVLGGIYILLDHQAELATQSADAFTQYNNEAKKLAIYQDKFKGANMTAAQVERFARNHFRWSALFPLLESITPEGIVIVDLSSSDYTITLNGQARTRDDFLRFEENLKLAECVSDVKVPISNLFSQKEVEFRVTFNVKRECLLHPLVE